MNSTAIDLDINNYDLNDLYNLFNIYDHELNYQSMKEAKKIVLKMHPDKSQLDSKYFLFFSNAYKKLYAIYEFQNKSSKKKIDTSEYFEEDKKDALNQLFQNNKKLEDPKQFSKWFNEQFEKHKLENEEDSGYGEWLKTNEGLYETGSVSQASLHTEFEKQKKKIQTVTKYTGLSDPFASTLGGTLLGKNDNFSSGLFNDGLQYQDLRQAHVETIIPITQEDYHNMPKFNSEQEYKMHRDHQDITPINEQQGIQYLRERDKRTEEESAHLAYYYAKQSEENSKKNNQFWSGIKYLQSK